MNTTEKTRGLVLKYFHSWQRPPDYNKLRACLADNLEFDGGMFKGKGGDAFREMIEQTESPWENVTLLDSVFTDEKAALIYEGVDTTTKIKTRVAEVVTVQGDKITRIYAVITPLNDSD